MRKLLWCIAITALVVALLPVVAHAQVVTNDGIDRVLTPFQTGTAKWVGPIQTIALGIFGGLAVIDLAWAGIKAVMHSGGSWDISTIMFAIVHETIYLSIFFWILVAFPVLGPAIIKGFQIAAGMAGGIPLTPNAIYNAGVDISKQIADQASIWAPGDAIAMLLCGLIVNGCFLWIVISMVYVIVESFFVVTAAQIVLMLGGIRFGGEAPVNLLRTVASIGLKLFSLQLIASIGTGLVQGWLAESKAGTVTFEGILYEIGETVLLAAITTAVPHMFERFMGGVGTGGASNVLGAGATIASAGSLIARAAVKAIEHASGAAAATAAAARLASAQAQGSGGASGRALQMVASTAKNLATAKAEDIGRGLRGQRSNLGQSSWRMSGDMTEQRRLLSEKQNKPTPRNSTP